MLTFLRDVSEPYLRIFRRFIPPIGMFDFTPMIAIIVLYFVRTDRRQRDRRLTTRDVHEGPRRRRLSPIARRARVRRRGADPRSADQAHDRVTGIAAGELHKFLPGIQLVHVRNTGVAFGVFSGGGALVLVFTLAALAVLLGYFARDPTRPWLWLPTGLLVGGALGNLIDRLSSGAVTDFIKLPLWPAFNVADMAITFGVLALLWVLEGHAAGR